MDLFRVNALQRQQEADSLQGVTAAIDEVSQEDVVEVLYVFLLAVLVGGAIKCEETHQISELSVDISEDLEGRLGL